MSEIKHIPTPQNFIYPEIKPEDFKFGSGQLSAEVVKKVPDWREYLPAEEIQRRNGIESSSCYVGALQNAYETVQEEKYGIIDGNYSERFNTILSDGTTVGGSPLKGAQSIRDDGMIPESLLPFDDEIMSWDEYHSFKGASETLCRLRGKEWRKKWNPEYEIVFSKNDPLEIKYSRIAERLKSSPLAVSVTAWYEKDGLYIKPEGMADGHLALATHLDPQGKVTIFDTYPPYIKILEPWFDFDFGMSVGIKAIPTTTLPNETAVDIINLIINWFKKLFK